MITLESSEWTATFHLELLYLIHDNCLWPLSLLSYKREAMRVFLVGWCNMYATLGMWKPLLNMHSFSENCNIHLRLGWTTLRVKHMGGMTRCRWHHQAKIRLQQLVWNFLYITDQRQLVHQTDWTLLLLHHPTRNTHIASLFIWQ